MADNADLIDFASYPVHPYWTKLREPLFEVIATIKNRVDRVRSWLPPANDRPRRSPAPHAHNPDDRLTGTTC